MCSNHYIQPSMKIDFKSDKELKILTWIAMDFSEDEGVMQKFSCRFKTEAIAAEFKVGHLLCFYCRAIGFCDYVIIDCIVIYCSKYKRTIVRDTYTLRLSC